MHSTQLGWGPRPPLRCFSPSAGHRPGPTPGTALAGPKATHSGRPVSRGCPRPGTLSHPSWVRQGSCWGTCVRKEALQVWSELKHGNLIYQMTPSEPAGPRVGFAGPLLVPDGPGPGRGFQSLC